MDILIALMLISQQPSMNKSDFSVLGHTEAPIMVTKGDFHVVGEHPRVDGFPPMAKKLDEVLKSKAATRAPVATFPQLYYYYQMTAQTYCTSCNRR